MAMIKCPDCKTGVSEHAQVCPKCGYPIANYIQQRDEKRHGLYDRLKSQNKDVEETQKELKEQLNIGEYDNICIYVQYLRGIDPENVFVKMYDSSQELNTSDEEAMLILKENIEAYRYLLSGFKKIIYM